MNTSSSDSAAGFGAAWLREQRALWQRFAASGAEDDFAAAQAAWDAACDRWWQQIGRAVPAPMAAQVHAALEHTRVLMRIARTMSAPGSPGAAQTVADPTLLFTAMLDAFTHDPAGSHDERAEAAYTRAYAALVAELSDIALEAFALAREHLAREPVHTPRALYDVYARTIEAHYRARAGSDAFARLVGDMINAQVDALAARRSGAP